MPNQPWKLKVQEMLQICQDEIKKTTEIGKKMLSASKTNSSLHEAYEELGMLVVKALDKRELKWNNVRVLELVDRVKEYEKDLALIEGEMNKLKFQAGTEDISKEGPKASKGSVSKNQVSTSESDVDKKSKTSKK